MGREGRSSDLARSWGAAIVLGCAVLLAAAQPASAAGPQIEGTVTSAVSKAPLDGVQVCQWADEGGNGGGCTTTNGAGEYTLDVGAAGTFVVYFDTTVEGLVPRTYFNGVYASREAKSVKVGEGHTVSGIDAAIEPGGSIAGEVRSAATKAALGGVEACAELPNVNQSFIEPHRECATTNGAGEYLIQSLTPGNGVPEGGYRVEFKSAADYIRQFYDGKLEEFAAKLIPVTLGATVAGVDAELEEGAEISGVVTSQVAGEPVDEAVVCAEAVAWPEYCVKSDATGQYTIAKLPSHEYRVHFGGPSGSEYIGQYYKEKEWPGVEPVNITAPQSVSGIDAALKAYGRISGTVVDKTTKKPIQGVSVCFSGGGGCEQTNAAGVYSLRGLTAGTYKLDFYAGRVDEEQGTNYLSQYEANEYIVQEELKARNPEAGHVEVKMGGDAVIDDELEEGGEISGTMLDAKTKKPAGSWPCAEDLSTGHPEHAEVCPYSVGEGTYAIKLMPPGRYRLKFGGGIPAYWFQQYYEGADQPSEAKEIVIESGEKLTVNPLLTANPDPSQGAIAGSVTDASTEKPIAGIEVCALYPHTQTAASPCVSSTAKGEYLLPGLWDGSYEVEFRSPAGGTLNYARTRYGGGKTVETVDGRLLPSVDAQMELGGSIAGTVTNSKTGTGAGGVPVCAYAGGGEPEECVTSEPGGAYELNGLPAGNYAVGFETSDADGAYFPRFYREALERSEAKGVPVSAGITTAPISESLIPNGHAGDGGLAGVVTDAVTHAPIQGIEVCAYKYLAPEEELTGGIEELFGTCAASASNGSYAITGLQPGDYELEFSSPASGSVSYLRQLYRGGLPVAVTAERLTGGLNAQMQPGGRIAGTVTSAKTGHGVGEVLVCAFGEEEEAGGCALSAASGSYVIPGLPTGRYVVGFDGDEQGFAIQYYREVGLPSEATEVSLSGTQTVAGIDARLQAGGSISGTVRSGLTGRTMEGVLVCALSPAETAVTCAVSEEDGSYDLTGLPPGDWRVGFEAGRGYAVEYWREVTEFASATPVHIAPGASVPGIDATLHTLGAKPVAPREAPPPSGAQPGVPPATQVLPQLRLREAGAAGACAPRHAPEALEAIGGRLGAMPHGAVSRHDDVDREGAGEAPERPSSPEDRRARARSAVAGSGRQEDAEPAPHPRRGETARSRGTASGRGDALDRAERRGPDQRPRAAGLRPGLCRRAWRRRRAG